MKKVKLTKVTPDEIRVMQEQIFHYSEALRWNIKNLDIEDFLNVLASMDIGFRLWLTFRKRVESYQDKFTLTLKVSEAVVLLKCFMWPGENRTDYEKNVTLKYKTIIDQQLKNI
ncbi:hypothetical protein FUA48_08500 [Flavobacterium alkalisoli]|uniref:Uncharacterized protein n=1 Tax=Flavobacterium alkalisoli TaxID=2602769 RepID=A0A5B9FRK5_9FLAO|nr:hypothetical protein [Flavobacterium alkalisoli]QEE49620.1 hypothetical protein FUA48_08500 [Flavobacterium alkalisoli]